MKRKAVSGIMLTLLLISMLTLAFNVEQVKASGTIVIEADGSINPPSANIDSSDNITYNFTDNNYDNIVVERNNIIVDGKGYTLQGSGSGVGFELVGISNVTIKNTNIKSFGWGVRFSASSVNNTVSGNNITSNSVGVRLSSSSGNIVSGNNITNNTNYGVYLLSSSANNFVAGNIIANNTDGIYLDTSSNNTVSGNTITENTDGVYFYQGCFNNTVSGNTITNNTSSGVYLRSFYTTVTGNNIIDNGKGVYLFLSFNNTFYHNNFINNTQQVYVVPSGYANFWNSSYPTGGNYWSNYIGVDDDGDGIGDTPHVLDAWNQDNYPYMNESGWVRVRNINTTLNYRTIQEAIDAIETLDGHTIQVDPWVYIENVDVDKQLNIYGTGADNTVVVASDPNDHVFHVTANNMKISGFKVINAKSTAKAGIYLDHSNYSIIENINAPNNDRGIWLKYSSNNSVSCNTITNSTIGVYLVSSSNNNSVSGNIITNSTTGVYLAMSSDNKFYHNNFISNTQQVYIATPGYANFWNSSYPSGGNYWSNYAGVDEKSGPKQDQPGSDGYWDEPYFIDGWNQDNYPFVHKDGWLRVHNINTTLNYRTIQEAIDALETLDGHTIQVDPWVYIENVDVDKELNIYGAGADITTVNAFDPNDHVFHVTADNVNISGFTVKDATGSGKAGVYLYYSDYSKMENINASNNNFGVYFYLSSDNTVSGNTITDNTNSGVRLISSSNNTVSGNTITNNTGFGVLLSLSSNNSVSGNTITNSTYGVTLLSSCNNNTFSDNTIANNSIGVRLASSSDNKFYHNNFIDNTDWQVYFQTPGYANVWNNSYLVGGNYWSDFEERYPGVEDILSGPKQDQPLSDGYWDEPYIIDDWNQDNYPFVHKDGWLRVHNLDTGGNFSTIQAAIDDDETLDGHTIQVDPWVYIENVDLYKELNIYGAGADDTVVVASDPNDDVFHVTANNVNMSGLTVKDATGWWSAGVYLDYSDYSNIENINVSNNKLGILLLHSSNNTVSGNTITNSTYGVYFSSSSYNTVSGNNITNNTNAGVHLFLSSYNNVSGNTITNNSYGILLSGADGVLIVGNIIDSNMYGIYLTPHFSEGGVDYDCTDNIITINTVSNNDFGIWLGEEWINEDLYNASGNSFYHNNFVDNDVQVYSAEGCTNFWNLSYPTGGNYWSNYAGADEHSGLAPQVGTGSDGIGDDPYVIDGDNQDNYPFMGQNGWETHPFTLESNVTITDRRLTTSTLNFNVSGPTGLLGYINITMPMGLNTTNIIVLVDGTELPPPFPIITNNSTHYFIYFEFTLSTHTVVIQFVSAHDVAVTNVTPSKTIVGQNYPMSINVTVENQGDYTETFNVTAYYRNWTRTPEEWETFWSMGDINRNGYIDMTDYDLWAAAIGTSDPDADLNQDGIVDLDDFYIWQSNYGLDIWTYFCTITAGQWETFWSMGDVNRDGYINETDQNLITAAMFSTPGDPNWCPWADLNQDNEVNINDFMTYAVNYGLEIWTYFISGAVIGTQTVVNLLPGASTTLTFTWNTTGVPYGNYTISAYAVPILCEEIDRADNNYNMDDIVLVTIVGDIDGDGDVDSYDFYLFSGKYGSEEGDENYDAKCDFDSDGDVDSMDFYIFSGKYGQSIYD